MTMSRTSQEPAIFGGAPVRDTLLPYGHQSLTEDDIQAVVDVLRSDWITNGPKVDEFEQAFALYVGGECKVDIWAGVADEASRRVWDENTLQLVFSTTKGATAICIAKLVEAGLLDYAAPVVQYWPEFGAHGKDTVTVEFPMAELTEKWTLPGQWWGWWPGHPAGTEFTFRFKGNTLVEIPPHPITGMSTLRAHSQAQRSATGLIPTPEYPP